MSSVMSNLSPSRTKLTASPPKSRGTSPTRLNDSPNKQYLELAAKLATITRDYTHLEDELTRKSQLVKELSLKVSGSERLIRSLEEERQKNSDLFHREIAFYRESVEELQRRNKRISLKLELGNAQSQADTHEVEEKYSKLMKSYKVLQSNLELEQNSRALLIDQIEYLTKERDFLLENANTVDLVGSAHDSYIRHNPYAGNTNDSDSDGSVHGTRLLDSLVEDLEGHQLDTSSPIKDVYLDSSLDVSQNFQFPPASVPLLLPNKSTSPPAADTLTKAKKRQSLPTKVITTPQMDQEPFVLSPLKLTNGSNSYFESSSVAPQDGEIKKRYSNSKPHHSRYNSHDIVPIRVEFELLDKLRSASSPDKDFLRQRRIEEENLEVDAGREKAFMKLHGYAEMSSKRDSFASSSKRSSLITDFNTLGNDVTKQEIMKLKFELQSLKLHNEKLLSYIGFELQKQKKNIRKLSSKQNLRGTIEYSDAKLIEKLKDMLIHKKRVLRAVSINPILSAKYDVNRKSTILQPGAGIAYGLSPNEDDDDFVFKSHFINSLDDCDDYGFLNHESKYNLRVLSSKNQAYLNEKDVKVLKKFKSQTFRHSMDIDEESYVDEEVSSLLDDEEWESGSDQSSEVVYSNLNTFNQMRYLIFGKDHLRKKTKTNDSLVDENLKYKFLTIVIGIVIVGIKFTNHPHQQLQN